MEKIVLFLGPWNNPIFDWLLKEERYLTQTEEKIDPDFIKRHNVWFLISYNYRHIIKKEVLDLLPNRAINLHISYLPWNRGADPNIWSWINDTPKGVTIHYLDKGIDTGDIIVQSKAVFCNLKNETLRTTYEKLHNLMYHLFIDNWLSIKEGDCPRIKQSPTGYHLSTYHTTKDRESICHLLTNGWDTPILHLTKRTDHDNYLMKMEKDNWKETFDEGDWIYWLMCCRDDNGTRIFSDEKAAQIAKYMPDKEIPEGVLEEGIQYILKNDLLKYPQYTKYPPKMSVSEIVKRQIREYEKGS